MILFVRPSALVPAAARMNGNIHEAEPSARHFSSLEFDDRLIFIGFLLFFFAKNNKNPKRWKTKKSFANISTSSAKSLERAIVAVCAPSKNPFPFSARETKCNQSSRHGTRPQEILCHRSAKRIDLKIAASKGKKTKTSAGAGALWPSIKKSRHQSDNTECARNNFDFSSPFHPEECSALPRSSSRAKETATFFEIPPLALELPESRDHEENRDRPESIFESLFQPQ